MATILFAWELGGGMGHVAPLFALVERLQAFGHRSFIALRDMRLGRQFDEPPGAAWLQSPYKPAAATPPLPTQRSFANVLANAGLAEPGELQSRTEAWDRLFDSVNPDLIVFDHAPTALLAARGRRVRRVVLGTGFCCPPDGSPLADLRSWLPPDPERLLDDERHILDCMNQVLKHRGVEPLERVTQLYGQVDATFLTTLPEFDHYPQRPNGRYRGPWSLPGGRLPAWPAGGGKRIYAYLNRFPGLPKILRALRVLGLPTIVFGGLDRQIRIRIRKGDSHQIWVVWSIC